MAGRFSIEAVFKALDRFSAPIGKMQSRLDKFSRSASAGIKQLNHAVDKAAEGMKTMAIGAVAIGTAAGAALFHVGEAGADFEQAITNVGAVMGKNRGQIAELEQEAMRLGVATQFSSVQVADAMEMMARKGFDAEEILQGIPGVLNAVAASGQSTAEVATVVGSAIRGFGLSAKDAAHVADIFAFSAEKTGATITDMGQAMSTAAPTAHALGVSITDTAAAVGLMQKMGIDASTAGSAVATMLAKISKPSKDAAQQMTAMGIKFQDAKGNMLPFREVLGQFVKAGDKAGGNMKRMGFLAELVGLRGDKAALALSDLAKSGDFDKLVDGLKNVDGYSEKVAKVRLDTTKGSWLLLTSTIEVLETKLFNLKSGALRGVIDGVNAWLQANQGLIVQDVQGFFQTVADNMGKIVLWTKRIVAGIAGFYAFAASVKVASVAMSVFEIAMKLASTAGSVLSAVLGVGKAAVLALADGTAASTAATVLNTGWTWAKTAAMAAYNAITWIGATTVALFTAMLTASTYSSGMDTAATWLRTAAVGAYNAIVGIGTTLIAAWNAGTLLSALRTGALTAATWLLAAAQEALNAIMSVNPFFLVGVAVIALVAWLIKLSGGWDAVKNAVVGFGTSALSFIEPVFDRVKGIVEWIEKAGKATGGFLGFGGTPESAVPATAAAPQVVSTSGVAAQALTSEQTNHATAEVTVKAEKGTSAKVTKAPARGGFGLNLAPSGAH